MSGRRQGTLSVAESPGPKVLRGRDFQAMLFDLDGVITRTASVHERAWKQLFDEFLRARAGPGGSFRPFTADDYLLHVDGRPRYEGVRTFLESRGIFLPRGTPGDDPGADTICGLGNRKNLHFRTLVAREGVEVYQPSVVFLKAVRALGIKTAVVSASENCRMVLEAAGLTGLFDVRVDGVERARLGLIGKPAPDTYLEAARRLGTEPSKAAVIEDAIAGVEAGRRGAFRCVIGIGGPEQAEKLKQAGANLVVASLGELHIER